MSTTAIADQAVSDLEAALSILSAESNKSDTVAQDNVDKCFLCIAHLCNVPPASPATVVRNAKSQEQKNRMANCLLRVLAAAQNAIWDDLELRKAAFSLLDETQGHLYQKLKLDKDAQNHEKLSILSDLESELQSQFAELAAGCTGLKSVAKTQQRFFQLLNDLRFKPFALFLRLSLFNENRLCDLFNAVNEFQSSEITKNFSAYNGATKLLSEFFSDLERPGGSKIETCVAQPLKKIRDMLTTELSDMAFATPTEISLKSSNRKYPLSRVGNSVQIKFLGHNPGPGYAFQAHVSLEVVPEELEVLTKEVSLGTVIPGEFEVVVRATVTAELVGNGVFGIQLSWCGIDGLGEQRRDFYCEIEPQAADVDWDCLGSQEPYSLEAIEDEGELVGREELLKRILAKLTAQKIGSSIIYGQKRVGKTSIAKVLQHRLQKIGNYLVPFIPLGRLDKTSASKFVSSLGESICSDLAKQIRPRKFDKPDFDSALTPLFEYLEQIHTAMPETKIVIIIDEFDEMPPDLYKQTHIGDTFFHNIRYLSSEKYIGFLLVGGENMSVIKQSTDKLNKFSTEKVDYFSKERAWNDFQELVRRPVNNVLEFSDEAMLRLMHFTEGNPFFTKLICGQVYSNACSDHNSFVSEEDMELSVAQAIDALDLNHVNHFWKDGLLEPLPEKRDQIETNRRIILVEYGSQKRCCTRVIRENLRNSPRLSLITNLDTTLEDFASRQVLVDDTAGIRCKPWFFERWLVEHGCKKISTRLLDPDAAAQLEHREANLYVQDKDILNCVNSWSAYKGRPVSATDVRAWLDQFENNEEKFLMFKILRSLKFYGEAACREKLTIIHKEVRRGLVKEIKEGEQKRRDILLSAFGEPSKSGPSMSRMYANVNQITVHNVVEFSKVSMRLKDMPELKALVFVDDIIASGQSVRDYLLELQQESGDEIAARKIKVVVGAICGLDEGVCFIEKFKDKLSFDCSVVVCDRLTESDKCFSSGSKIFGSLEEVEKAKEVAVKYGRKLYNKFPLGYADGQLLVVFHDTCPNNTLPILFASPNGNYNWLPLFLRS